MKPMFFKLPNGLRVVLIDTKAFPTMTVIMLFAAGSRYENEKNNGIAHFFEHILFKGSKKYPSTFAISSVIEGMGAVNNAFTGKDHTGYWIKGTVQHFGKMIDILSDMIIEPLLNPKEIEREKGVIVEEINMYEDSPGRKVGDMFENLLYQGSPLGFDTTGTKETVTSFSRETFLDYRKMLYQPSNAVLVVAGGLNLLDKKGSTTQFLSHESLTTRQTRGPLESEKIAFASPLFNSYLDTIKEKFTHWDKEGEKAGFSKVIEKQNKPDKLIKYTKSNKREGSKKRKDFFNSFLCFLLKKDKKRIEKTKNKNVIMCEKKIKILITASDLNGLISRSLLLNQ